MTLVKARDVPRRPSEPARNPSGEPTGPERRLAAVVARAVSGLQLGVDDVAVQRALNTRNVPGLMASLDFTSFIEALAPIREQLAREIATSANAYSSATGVDTTFRSVDPNVIRAANLQAGRMISQVTDSTREAVRRVVTTAIASQELTVRDVSTLLRQIVGVTPASAQAIARARTKAFSDAVTAGQPAARAEKNADRLAAQMRKRAVASRARTVARTEILGASNSGRYLTWNDAASTGIVTPAHRKEWIATAEGNRRGGPCPICAPLDGQIIPWDSDFPGIGKMPPAHPNCRCTATLRAPDPTAHAPKPPAPTPAPPEVTPAAPPRGDKYPHEELMALRTRAGKAGKAGSDVEHDMLILEANSKYTQWLQTHFRTSTGDIANRSTYGLSPAAKKARDKYVIDDDATLKMNASLRAGRAPSAKAKAIDAMIDESTIVTPILAYRSEVLPDDVAKSLKVGDTRSNRAFQSTDLSEGTALFYGQARVDAGFPGRVVLFEHAIPAGQNAAFVGAGEVVLPRNATSRIVDITPGPDGVLVVKVETVRE